MTMSTQKEVFQPGFIIMIDSNPLEKFLCLGDYVKVEWTGKK